MGKYKEWEKNMGERRKIDKKIGELKIRGAGGRLRE
jgi:hypothetical protein